MPVLCTTEQFWQAMCRLDFVRTGPLTGRAGRTCFLCIGPAPEDAPGFMEARIRETLALLPPPRPWFNFRGFWSRVWNR